MINKQDSEFDEFDEKTAAKTLTIDELKEESVDEDIQYKRLVSDFFQKSKTKNSSDLKIDIDQQKAIQSDQIACSNSILKQT